MPAGNGEQMPQPSLNYERVKVLEQDHAEWFAHIYYAYRTDPRRDGLNLPFDLVLVGRPVWIRAKYVAVSPGSRTAQRELDQS